MESHCVHNLASCFCYSAKWIAHWIPQLGVCVCENSSGFISHTNWGIILQKKTVKTTNILLFSVEFCVRFVFMCVILYSQSLLLSERVMTHHHHHHVPHQLACSLMLLHIPAEYSNSCADICPAMIKDYQESFLRCHAPSVFPINLSSCYSMFQFLFFSCDQKWLLPLSDIKW